MRVMIVGDNSEVVELVQAAVVRSGFECRETDLVPYDQAPDCASVMRRDFTIVLMSSEQRRSLELLKEVRNTVESPIVAVGPANDPKYILHSLRSGADAYVDESEVDQELDGAMASLKSKGSPQHDGGTVIGILSPSGGNGSSTIAANLASAISLDHGPTALFDLRFAAGDQSLLLDLKPSHSISDLCRNCARLDHSMFELCLTNHRSGVSLLAAPGNNADIRSVSVQGVRKAVAMARASFPFVVLDLDRSFAVEQMAAIVQCDVLLLTLHLKITSVHNTGHVLNDLEEMGIHSPHVKLVVNQYGQPRELPIRKAEEALGIKAFHTIPNDPANVNASINKGVPLVLERPRTKAARSFRTLAELMQKPKSETVPESTSPARQSLLSAIAAQYL
jgi:pilus assembly protein CpaE